MLCPRCHLTLQPTEYEGLTVSFCDACWGHWLTVDQLDRIIADRSSRFSSAERKTIRKEINDSGDKDRHGAEHRTAACPVCAAEMNKRTYKEDCPIIVDACPSHGVWLDAGELKELQVLHE